jgi:hypothetical protein
LTERIDIREPVATICRALGFEPTDIGRIILWPGEAEIEVFVYLNNKHGSKYIDLKTKLVASRTERFEVLT